MKTSLLSKLGVGLLMLMPLSRASNAGIISIKNNTASSGIGTSTVYFHNMGGGLENYDGLGNPQIDGIDSSFIPPTQTNALQIYSIIPSLGGDDKASTDAHPIDTFGWDFYLGVKGSVSNIDNYLRYKINDSTDLTGKTLNIYDVSSPSTKYELLQDNAYHNITLPNLTQPAGEYAHWRLDVGNTPEPSSLVALATGALAVGGWGVYNMMRGKKEEK